MLAFSLLLSLAFFLYSYGFTDFNLTLSSHPAVTGFVSWSQQLAMFDRPLSLKIYLLLVTASFLLYLLILKSAHKLTSFPWRPVILLAAVYVFAYPLLSSDVFKYLFGAKTIFVYHANPHLVAPQVFEGDTWLRFMRWIHTPSPYGPIETVAASLAYLAAFGKFVPTLYLYKLMQLGWYLLSIWLIGKLATPTKRLSAQLYFAANPLILWEWLANAHNDAIMLSLLLLSIYFLKLGRQWSSLLALLLSIGVKFVTVVYLPLVIFVKKTSLSTTFSYLMATLLLAPLLYHYSIQYQPWYVTWLIPFAALLGRPWLKLTIAAYSLGSLLRYLPFIATGFWLGTPTTFALLSFAPPAVILLYFGFKHLRSKQT